MSFWNKLFGKGAKPKFSTSTEADKPKKNAGDYAAWAEQNNIQSESEAWAKLKRPDWMLLMANNKGVNLDESKLRLFACDCAEAVLLYFEARYPTDKRPREAVETARRFAEGAATKEALAAAEAAASTAFSIAKVAMSAAKDAVEIAQGSHLDAARAIANTQIFTKDGFRSGLGSAKAVEAADTANASADAAMAAL